MATPALRVDLVGSFLRPERLKEAYRRHGLGEISDEELRQAQDEAIRDVLAQQEAHGIPVVTDGEFRRLNFQDKIASAPRWRDSRLRGQRTNFAPAGRCRRSSRCRQPSLCSAGRPG